MSQVKILFRCCEAVPCFSGGSRISNIQKAELIELSFLSLLNTISHALENTDYVFSLTIVHDQVSSKLLKKIISYCTSLRQNPNFLLSAHSIDEFFITDNLTGNGRSLKACYHLADSADVHDLIFFVEDDYLHEKSTLTEMLDIYTRFQEKHEDIVVHPCDYPDRYNQVYPSTIHLGTSRHWRTIKHTTCTFMLSSNVFNKYRVHYTDFTLYGSVLGISEDNTLNLVYDSVACLSPIPSLSVHYQYDSTLSPFVSEQSLLLQAKNLRESVNTYGLSI